MAIPRFRSNPIIREFNGLKRLFREHETRTSRQRIADLKGFCRLARDAGQDLAFDILGSVNFGQAQVHSDTDIVMYTRCQQYNEQDCDANTCRKVGEHRREFTKGVGAPYPLEIVDCLDLNAVDRDLANRDISSGLLIRFGFYRCVCRSVNGRLLRRYETRLASDSVLCETIENSLIGCCLGLIHSSQHSYSFRKYVERVEAEGYRIPDGMAEKIREYLDH